MADNEETKRLVFGDDWYARARSMNAEDREYVLAHARAAAAEMSDHLGVRVELDVRDLLDPPVAVPRHISEKEREMLRVVEFMQSEEGRKSPLDPS